MDIKTQARLAALDLGECVSAIPGGVSIDVPKAAAVIERHFYVADENTPPVDWWSWIMFGYGLVLGLQIAALSLMIMEALK